MFFNSLVGRILIISFLLFLAAIGAVTLFYVQREHGHISSTSINTAEIVLSVIERSLKSSMSMGNSRDVQKILEMVGTDENLIGVRIFDLEGRILKSSDPYEIGRRVNVNNLSAFLMGKESNIFRDYAGQEIMGVVRPIFSEEGCVRCHGPDQNVLGVLNLDYALGGMANEMVRTSELFGVTMFAIVLLLTGGVSLIFRRFVSRPLQSLADQMALVEDGDLEVKLEPQGQDEVSRLMLSFNSMVEQLRKASQEIEQYHYEQMERVDRLASVGEMAAGIAHEIKNPLAGINGAISVLYDDFPAEDPRREVIQKVLEQISRLDKAATDLLFFGRPGKPTFAYTDINDLLKKTMFFVSQHPEAKKIQQLHELTQGLPEVWVDAKQLQQVFFNIIINAVQAMKESGVLQVKTSLIKEGDGEFVQVTVADSGPGMKKEVLDKIFTPFFTTKTQGTGLGLAICRQLTEQQGGTIQIESRVGEGTCVIIKLPVNQFNQDMTEEK